MSGVALTGAGGFLGWHTRAALRERGTDATPVRLGARFELSHAVAAVDGVERVIHIAGINRATDEKIRDGNVTFASQLASAVLAAKQPPRVIAYANSTQAGNRSAYGESKAVAAEVLKSAADSVGAAFHDLRLPNLFGEHGRPFYNAVTSTFAHVLAEGGTPEVTDDKQLTLLHAQDAADLLTGATDPSELDALVAYETVSGLSCRLSRQSVIYRAGEIPDVSTKFDRDLFNTYRSYTFPAQAPIRIARHADRRGSFFEIVRTHGGTGQSSFSTTEPGISRGDHFHRRKIERFTVLAGSARIELRRFGTGEIVRFAVTGEEPVAVDMPTMWAHRIVNTGSDVLYTSFWTDDLFDPAHPDTIAEVV